LHSPRLGGGMKFPIQFLKRLFNSVEWVLTIFKTIFCQDFGNSLKTCAVIDNCGIFITFSLPQIRAERNSMSSLECLYFIKGEVTSIFAKIYHFVIFLPSAFLTSFMLINASFFSAYMPCEVYLAQLLF